VTWRYKSDDVRLYAVMIDENAWWVCGRLPLWYKMHSWPSVINNIISISGCCVASDCRNWLLLRFFRRTYSPFHVSTVYSYAQITGWVLKPRLDRTQF